jgi:hypothetical protein
VPVPRGPGLGVALNWDFIRQNQAGKAVYE